MNGALPTELPFHFTVEATLLLPELRHERCDRCVELQVVPAEVRDAEQGTRRLLLEVDDVAPAPLDGPEEHFCVVAEPRAEIDVRVDERLVAVFDDVGPGLHRIEIHVVHLSKPLALLNCHQLIHYNSLYE